MRVLAVEAVPGKADVVVVGAGVVGLCVAHALVDRGREVLLVDQGAVGSGASAGNAGFVAPSHSIPLAAPGVVRQALRWMVDPASPFYVRPRLDLGLAAWMLRFVWASRRRESRLRIAPLRQLLGHSADLFEELAARSDLAFTYPAGGVLNVYATDAGLRHGADDARLLERHGVESRLVAGEHLNALEPSLAPSLAGGILWPGDRFVDPEHFVTELAASLRGRGVQIATGTELVKLDLDGCRVRALWTTSGPIEPAEVVLAAGAWSAAVGRLLGLRLPVQAAKGYSLTGPVDPSAMPRRPLLLADAKVAVTPLAGRLRIAGTLELAGLDWSVNWRRVEAIRAAAQRFLPGAILDRACIWRGLRCMSPDGLPIIGRTRQASNVTVATGHGHLGLSLAPATGAVVADAIIGAPPLFDLAPFSPERF